MGHPVVFLPRWRAQQVVANWITESRSLTLLPDAQIKSEARTTAKWKEDRKQAQHTDRRAERRIIHSTGSWQNWTSIAFSRQNLQKVCSCQLTISLGKQRAASALPSPVCLTARQRTKLFLPPSQAIKQAHQWAHFQSNLLHVSCGC